VTSIDAFARYHHARIRPRGASCGGGRAAVVGAHGPGPRAPRRRGRRRWGARLIELARAAAYSTPPDDRRRCPRDVIASAPARRARGQRTSADGVYDPKLGRGALLDVELIVQFCQIVNGPTLPEPARTPETPLAIEALTAAGVLEPARGRVLADAYAFLRRLELRVRVVRADASHVLDARSPAMVSLARRMGTRDRPNRSAVDELLARYRQVTEAVRAEFDEVFRAPAG
jgi:glutamate-ammonia-ligase adenylyltransferase